MNVIEEGLCQLLERSGSPGTNHVMMQTAFVSALYLAAAAINMEGFGARDISETARRIEDQVKPEVRSGAYSRS